VNRGAYAAGTTYAQNDVVFYEGSSYINVAANGSTGTAPSVGLSTATWRLMARGFPKVTNYSAGTTYQTGQVVTLSGNSYMSGIDNNLGNDPASAPATTWARIAAKGDTGAAGTNGTNGAAGAAGATGPAGPGVAAGGTSNQVLAKNSATDYDTKWVTPSSGGGGGVMSPWRSGTGNYATYIAPMVTPANFVINTTLTGFPIRIPNACSLARVQAATAAAASNASTTVEVYLYTDNGQSRPGVKLGSAVLPFGNGAAGMLNELFSPYPVVIADAMNCWVLYRCTASTTVTMTGGVFVVNDMTTSTTGILTATRIFGGVSAGAAVPNDMSAQAMTMGTMNGPVIQLWTS
jgi:hypothetical protein